MQNIKIISREWRELVKNEPDVSEKRLFCTMDDGSVYSCDNGFGDWQKEEPSTAELETSLAKIPQ